MESVHETNASSRTRIEHFPSSNISQTHRTSIVKFLKEHFVHELMPPSGISVIFDSELNVGCAFYALQEQEIIEAPIWDSSSQRLIGMLTVSTFIEVLLHNSDAENHVNADIGAQTIKDWLDALGRLKEQFITVDPDASLYSACEYLRKYRVHRLPVIEEQGDDQCVLFVVDYLKILHFLLRQLGTQSDPLSRTIGELGVGAQDNVVTCSLNTTLIQVLHLLYQNNITSIPVVDENGVVLDLISRVDFLCLAREHAYRDLNITVGKTIELRNRILHAQSEPQQQQQQQQQSQQQPQSPPQQQQQQQQQTSQPQSIPTQPLATCSKTDSLIQVFEKFALHNTTGLIIVDENQRLEGILSLHDLFNLFV